MLDLDDLDDFFGMWKLVQHVYVAHFCISWMRNVLECSVLTGYFVASLRVGMA